MYEISLSIRVAQLARTVYSENYETRTVGGIKTGNCSCSVVVLSCMRARGLRGSGARGG